MAPHYNTLLEGRYGAKRRWRIATDHAKTSSASCCPAPDHDRSSRSRSSASRSMQNASGNGANNSHAVRIILSWVLSKPSDLMLTQKQTRDMGGVTKIRLDPKGAKGAQIFSKENLRFSPPPTPCLSGHLCEGRLFGGPRRGAGEALQAMAQARLTALQKRGIAASDAM